MGGSEYEAQRRLKAGDLAGLPEQVQMEAFLAALDAGTCLPVGDPSLTLEDAGLTPEAALTVLDAALLTSALHVESRVAAVLGQGFYTIG